MLLRIRCKAGNFRFELGPSEGGSELVQKVQDATKAVADSLFFALPAGGGKQPASFVQMKSLEQLKLKHGDLINVTFEESPTQVPNEPSTSGEQPHLNSLVHPPDATHRPWELVKEDPVDEYWRKQDGKIPRTRDATFCKHGANAMCDYCMPLEPYDPKYHAEQNIKHLSYHAYLQKLQPAKSTSSSTTALLPPLEPLIYKVKQPCPIGKHAPWPEGICSSCQPSAITLQPQPFRMVDHLEFSTHEIVNRFLDAWRRTGTQRFGWLIGHYEPYDKVPMGIKAVVEAIHEPPQEGELDGLTLGVWEEEPAIRNLAASSATPMTIVGYIFTDLEPSEEDKTKNVYKRHPHSFYMSSLEALFAARLQLQNPTPSRSSTTGKFSSRLVTAVATGTSDGGIDINAYQVSEQACAMVDADMIEASVEPGIVRVKEEDRSTNSARYVPDVFFRYKNEYKLDVQKSAKPCFPVEYLIVNVTHGFPQNANPLFLSHKFPIENRPGLEDTNVQRVLGELAKLRAPELSSDPGWAWKEPNTFKKVVEYISDWHFLAFLPSTGLVNDYDMRVFIRAASTAHTGEAEAFYDLFKTQSWATMMTFAQESAPAAPAAPSYTPMDTDMDELPQDIRDQIAQMEAMGGEAQNADAGVGPGPSAAGNIRICPHCTFENHGTGTDCDVCGLPLG